VTVWTPPTAQERLAILRRTRSVAIIGASPNPNRASYFVASYLLAESRYRLWFVNPTADMILGQRVYPELADLPEVPDVVDVFRNPNELKAIAEDAIAVGTNVLWLQLGLWDEAVGERATESGLEVVMDRCMKIEHARFKGGLHLVGFDTGVISSRRRADLS
jgi:predicted CoA-binding protein